MSPPTKLEQTPTSWIRSATGRGRIVVIIQSTLIIDDETAKLRDTLSVADQAKRYWVFGFSHAFLDYDVGTNTFTVTFPAAPVIKNFASNSYDDSEQRYADWALPDAGKAVNRGLAGLQQIGRED